MLKKISTIFLFLSFFSSSVFAQQEQENGYVLLLDSEFSYTEKSTRQSNNGRTDSTIRKLRSGLEAYYSAVKVDFSQSDNLYNLHTRNSSLGLNYRSGLNIRSIRGVFQLLLGRFTLGFVYEDETDLYEIESGSGLPQIFEENLTSSSLLPGIGYYSRDVNIAIFQGGVSPEYKIFSENEIDQTYEFIGTRTFGVFSYTIYVGIDQKFDFKLIRSIDRQESDTLPDNQTLDEDSNYLKFGYKKQFSKTRRFQARLIYYKTSRELSGLSEEERSYYSFELGMEFNSSVGVGLVFTADEISKRFEPGIFQSINQDYQISEDLIGIRFSLNLTNF